MCYDYVQIAIVCHNSLFWGAINFSRPLWLRPVHLLRVSLLKVLESNFPEDPL